MQPLQNIVFSDAHQKWRETAREIAKEHLLPNAAKHDQEASYNEAAFAAAAEAGMLGIWIPAAYGGSEDGITGLALAVEEFSKADPAFGVASTSPRVRCTANYQTTRFSGLGIREAIC